MAPAERRPRPLLSAAARITGLREVPPALTPLLGVMALGGAAFSAFWAFVAVWAKEVLHASDLALGATFAASAVLAALIGSAGGALSDRFGRRPVILCGWAGSSLAALMGWLAGSTTWLGLGSFILAGTVGALAQGADQALAADLVPPERREEAFAATRLALNLGIAVGPLLAAAALALGSWDAFFAVAVGLAAVAYAVALRWLPRSGDHSPGQDARASLGRVLRDPAFAAFWVAGVLQFGVYSASETLLPVSMIESHGYSAAMWGVLAAINPCLVVLLQMRVTRRFGGTAGVTRRLVASTLLMSVPFAALAGSTTLAVVAGVIAVFVLGEMIWIPTAYAAVERMAPPTLRGTYLGAFSATGAVGFAIAPFSGLQLRAAADDATMWLGVAGVGIVATVFVLAAMRRVGGAAVAQPPP